MCNIRSRILPVSTAAVDVLVIEQGSQDQTKESEDSFSISAAYSHLMAFVSLTWNVLLDLHQVWWHSQHRSASCSHLIMCLPSTCLISPSICSRDLDALFCQYEVIEVNRGIYTWTDSRHLMAAACLQCGHCHLLVSPQLPNLLLYFIILLFVFTVLCDLGTCYVFIAFCFCIMILQFW